MPRIMTMRGMRALDRSIALPRETQAAARTIQAVGAKRPQIVEAAAKGSGPFTDVLSEAFADAMSAMAIKRDPYVSMMSILRYLTDDSGTTTPTTANFFNAQAAGAAASGVAGVWHNLLDDRQPLKPCLVHTIGISMHVQDDEPFLSLAVAHSARVTLQRNKEDLFEFPLMHALVGAYCIDAAGTAAPIIDLEPLAGGGLEIEGHGAPFLMDEAIGLKLDFPIGGALAALGTSETGGLYLVARVDGEVMDV